MEPDSLNNNNNKRYGSCRCGDSRLVPKTNHNFFSKCGQCKQKWCGPLCSNCCFHCCLRCRKSNQNYWKQKVSKLSHWNDNALKQQEEYKQILHSIPQIFLLYNDKTLVQTLCTHIYNARNKEVLSILLDILGENGHILLDALYPIFESVVHLRNLSELIYIKEIDIITKQFLYQFRKKNGINILHYICTFNLSLNDTSNALDEQQTKHNIEIIKIIMEWIVKYKLLHRNIYDITSIFQFSVHCNSNTEHEGEIIKILDTFVINEIRERGLRKWIDGYSLRRLPLYNYTSWRYASRVPFSIMKWVINNTIKYQIVPYFLRKYEEKTQNKNHGHHRRSLSYGHLPRFLHNRMEDNDDEKIKSQRESAVKFKTYNRIFYPLLVMESNYISHRSLIYEWMKLFIDMDSEIVLLKSCDKHSLPINDAMTLNSNMVETIMSLCKDELYLHYSLHSFIDIACRNPKLEYRVLQWIQFCIEKYDSRLLFKNVKHLSIIKYAEQHPTYYCSQIILYLKRKERSKSHNSYHLKKNLSESIEQKEVNNEYIVENGNNHHAIANHDPSTMIAKLRTEITQLREENKKWKEKYFKLNKMYQSALKTQQNEVHNYPTPKPVAIEKSWIQDTEEDLHMRERNGFALKAYIEWSGNDLAHWIIHLNHRKYKKYENILKSNIIKENIKGTHLEILDRNDLSRLGINDFDDKCNIIQEIQTLVMKQNEEIQKEGVNNDVFRYPSPN